MRRFRSISGVQALAAIVLVIPSLLLSDSFVHAAAEPAVPIAHTTVGSAVDAPIINSSPLTAEQQTLSFPKDFAITQDIVNLPNHHVLFLDRSAGTIYMNDLSTGRNVWSRTYNQLLSYKMLPTSDKLVLIVQEKDKLQKLVLNSRGETLSTFTFPAALRASLSDTSHDAYQLSWSAPLQKGEKERIALEQGGEVRIYESPWKKPIRTFKLQAVQANTAEDIVVRHMEYQSDRLVIQYAAHSLVQTEAVFELMDTSTTTYKGKVILMPWNLSSEFQLENGQAVIYSYNDNDFALGISGATAYPIYRRYDVATGKLLFEKTHVFADQQPRWTTEYSNEQLLLSDTYGKRMYLYDKAGQELWQLPQLSDKLLIRFIKYDNKQLYLLVETQERQFKLVKMPLI